MKIIQTLLLILILLLSSVCLILPIPQSSNDGAKIDSLLGRLTVGSTTKEEVISALGQPHNSIKNYSTEGKWGEIIVYWNKDYRRGTKGILIIADRGETLPAGSSTLMDLHFTLDNHGKLISYWTESGRAGEKVISYDSKNDSKQICNFNCYEADNACLGSINEGEDTSKGTLRCEKEKEICFKECKATASLHSDCDPGMESCD